ncbi:MAG: alpha/beta hydrolase [Acidobacteriota bacterium]|nr:alpha/beta hydrolase [Acidobacteriota bacterium]
MNKITVLIITLCSVAVCFAQNIQVKRNDFYVAGESNIRLFVREVKDTGTKQNRTPVLLLHGARVPGVASFDLPVAGGSLAADLASGGYTVYVMDARGYGKSTRPAEMLQPPEANLPLVRSAEVVSDINAVVEAICKRNKVEKVALFGWATGGHWLGFYASLHPNRVSHLIFDNSLYGATPAHPTLGKGSNLENPEQKGTFNVKAFGAYRLNTAESLISSWNNSIALADKSQWRDASIVAAYQQAAMDSDSTAKSRTPNTFRSPTGALEDSFYLAIGRGFWDASLIKARTLILRSEKDFWSRPEDVERLKEHLIYAKEVRAVTIPNATHFVHLDRAERGRELFLKEIINFLSPKPN